MEMNIELVLNNAFSALANAKRRNVITALSLQPLSISQLAEFENLSLPAIHKHIAVLEEAQLVHRRKIGRSNFLVLNNDSLFTVQEWLLQHQTQWGSSKATLENYDPEKRKHYSQLSSWPNTMSKTKKVVDNKRKDNQ